jgi:hypothetical protein
MRRDRSSLLMQMVLLSMFDMPAPKGRHEAYVSRPSVRPAAPRIAYAAEKRPDDPRYIAAQQKRERKNAKRAALALARGEKP